VRIQPKDVWRAWAEIRVSALKHNALALRARALPDARLFAVVKADAYGHGVEIVVPALNEIADGFAVANLEEARQVRSLSPVIPVLIMGPALAEERGAIAEAEFLPTISSFEEAAAYAQYAREKPVAVHLAVDTGMGRIGVLDRDVLSVVRAIAALPGVRIAGIGSHFPVADEDPEFTIEQSAQFAELVRELRVEGLVHGPSHIANSAGVLGFPAASQDIYRAGLALYGVSPLQEYQSLLQAVMTFKTRVTLLRDVPPGSSISYGRTFVATQPTRVATLALGYADGYRRHLSGRGAEVLIRGRRCPVLGRVTMDQVMVDVTEVKDVVPGDEVVVLGRQGGAEISAAALADLAGTIPWDIFTGIGRRVARLPVE